MINLKDKALTAYYENYKPISAIKNGKKITEFKLDPIKGENLSVHENTYNALAQELIIYGKSDNIPSGFLSGNAIVIPKQDMWQIAHEVNCRIERKNLCPPPQPLVSDQLGDVTKIEEHADGTFDISGTYTSGSQYISPNIIQAVTLPAGTYTASSNSSYIELFFDDKSANTLPHTFTLDKESSVSFGFYMADFSENGIYLQIEKGDAASEYFPYDLANYDVSCYGKNLFDSLNAKKLSGSSSVMGNRTKNSITVTQGNILGSWISGNFALPNELIGQKITVSAIIKTSGTNTGRLRVMWTDGKTVSTAGTATDLISSAVSSAEGEFVSITGTVKKSSNPAHNQLCLCLYSAVSYGDETSDISVTYSNIQVEIGSVATEFEPYIAPTLHTPHISGDIIGIIADTNITILSKTPEMTLNCSWFKRYNDTSLLQSKKPAPDNPRPIVSAKGVISATGREPFNGSNSLMLNEDELRSIEVDNTYPYNLSKTINEKVHYYIADTFNNGVLTENTSLRILTGSEDWSIINQDNLLLAVMPFSDADMALCSHYIYGSALVSGEFDIADGYIRFNLSGVADSLEKWKEFLNYNDKKLTAIKILYPLKTPIVKSLDANLTTLPEYTKITSSAVEGWLTPILSGYIKTANKEK